MGYCILEMEMGRGHSSMIVDLTSNDDLIPSIEHDDAPARVGRAGPSSALYGRRDEAAAPPFGNSTPSAHSLPPPSQPFPPKTHLSPYFVPYAQSPFQQPAGPVITKKPLDLDFIIKPIDPVDVLHRTAYDPKTIARDVLLATGLHPQRPGLNCHLRALREHFTHVNDSSDLSTFRWDLVDPGGPSPHYISMPPTYGLGVTSTPARNSDHFQSHGAQFRPSSLPRRPMDPTPNRPSLLRNSTLPTSGSPIKVELPSFSPAQGFEYSRMESPDLDEYDELYPTASQSRPGASSVLQANSYANFASPNASTPTTTTGKKRGRPFGKTPLSGASTSGTSTPTNGSETTKKRGRPFGNSYGAAGSSFKKRGRPKVLQPDIEIPEPKFIAFLCEWKDCPAELQNLETLRLHLFNVHGKPQKSGTTPCLWNKCGLKHADDQSMKFASGTKHLEFDNKEKWQNHMSKAHLIPIAWHLGDGPRGSTMDIPSTSLSPKSQPWLYDLEGRQVTPSVQNQRTEGGRARDNNARRFAKQQRGIYVVVGPVKNPEEYVKVSMDEDDDDDVLL